MQCQAQTEDNVINCNLPWIVTEGPILAKCIIRKYRMKRVYYVTKQMGIKHLWLRSKDHE